MFLFSSSRLSFSIYILCFLNLYSAEGPKVWLCADESCSAPISEATVDRAYTAADSSEKIIVKQGQKLDILKKPADASDKYYYVRTKEGIHGLLKVDFFKEKNIFVRQGDLVKVDESSKNKTPDISSSASTERMIEGTMVRIESSHSYEPTRDHGRNYIGSPGAVQSTVPPSHETSLNVSDGKSKTIVHPPLSRGEEVKSTSAAQPQSEHNSYTPKNSSAEQRDSSQVEQDVNTQSTNKNETKTESSEPDGEQESKLNDSTPMSTSIYHTPATNNYDSQSKGYNKDVLYGTIGSAMARPQNSPISTQIDDSQTHENTTSFKQTTNVEEVSGEESKTHDPTPVDRGEEENGTRTNDVQSNEHHSNTPQNSSTEQKNSSQVAANLVGQEMYTRSTNKNETKSESNGTVSESSTNLAGSSSAVEIAGHPSSENSQKISGGEQESKTNNTTPLSSSEEENGASAAHPPQNSSTEQSDTSQVVSNPVEQEMDTQSTNKNETNAESKVGTVSESSTNLAGSSSAVASVASPPSENPQKVSGGEQESKTNDTTPLSSSEEENGASAEGVQTNERQQGKVAPQNSSTEQSDTSQVVSNPVEQEMDTQSTNKNETNAESKVGTVSESSTNHAGSSSAAEIATLPSSENSQKISGGEQESKTNDTTPLSGSEEVNGASAAGLQQNERQQGKVAPENSSTEQSDTSQVVSSPVEQEVDENETRTESKGNVSESSDGGSTDEESLKQNHSSVHNSVDEMDTSGNSNTNIGSNGSEASAVHTKNVTNVIEDSIHSTDGKSHSVSTSHGNMYTHHNEQLKPPMSLVNSLRSYAKDSSVEVPESATVHNPTNIPATTQPQDFVSEVNVDVTTTPMPSPSQQPESDLSPIVDRNSEVQENTSEELPLPIQEDSVGPWYSSVGSIFASMQEMFLSSETESDIIPSEVAPKLQVDDEPAACTTNTCDIQPQIDLVSWNELQGIEKDNYHQIIDYVWMSPGGITLMIISAIAVLLFSLGYYYLENLRRDVELVTKYNDLAGKLFIEQKEKEMLAEQLTSVNESMSQMSYNSTKYDEELSDLKTRLQKYKEEKTAIEEKEKETRKKFMMVDKNYNELRNILSQNKQKGERSALILDIKNLKDSIAGNNVEIASLKEQLLEKKEEIKSLNTRIMEFMEANKQLEKNVEKAISEKHETVQKYQDNIARLERTIEESTVARVKLEKECTLLKKEKESLAIEKELAESSLQKFQRLKPSNALAEWLDAKEVRVSLLAAEKKIEELTSIRDELTRDKTLVEEKEKTLVVDFEQLNEKYEKAEKEKIEALTKLQVLSDYFKEKETQLQEELGTKESLWLQKQSDDRTIYEQMRGLREENASFKNQNETLKREILDQEASFKKLITSSEEKAHENWVALRHQERRLKEAQMEAAQLRSRLTTLESAGDHSDDKINKGEVNGDMPPYGSATSPPFMMYPEFVPPPPLLTTTPSRPPPLGRISSPPLGDFTPPPPLVPYEMFLPPSPPPPAPHVLHKPQPLDGSHRIQKDSQSSNHSSESAPDRTRRNKR